MPFRGRIMKRILYLFLENSPIAIEVLQSIRDGGFNGTMLETISVRHALDGNLPEETHFFNLMDWDILNNRESTVTMFLIDEDKVETLKQTIRDHTQNFNKVKGGMFTKKVEDFEGTI